MKKTEPWIIIAKEGEYARKSKRWDKYIDNSINIINICFKNGDLENAEYYILDIESYYNKCLTERAPAMGTVLHAKYHLKNGNFELAQRYHDLAVRYSKNVSYLPHLADLYALGIELNNTVGNLNESQRFFELYKNVTKSMIDNSSFCFGNKD